MRSSHHVSHLGSTLKPASTMWPTALDSTSASACSTALWKSAYRLSSEFIHVDMDCWLTPAMVAAVQRKLPFLIDRTILSHVSGVNFWFLPKLGCLLCG